MDQDRFDALTRQLATASTRRRFLSLLASAAAASAFAVLGVDRTAARPCRDAGHACEGTQECCAGFMCVTTGPGSAKRCVVAPTPAPCIPSTQPCEVGGYNCCDPTYVCRTDTRTDTCGVSEVSRCCGESQSPCTSDCDCCGFYQCLNGLCF